MGMSVFYGGRDEAEAVAAINRALDLGVTFLNTADMYGVGANEELVGRVVRERRDWIVGATKLGIALSLTSPALAQDIDLGAVVKVACARIRDEKEERLLPLDRLAEAILF